MNYVQFCGTFGTTGPNFKFLSLLLTELLLNIAKCNLSTSVKKKKKTEEEEEGKDEEKEKKKKKKEEKKKKKTKKKKEKRAVQTNFLITE
jgi:flagellar biosynthesis component FlhA